MTEQEKMNSSASLKTELEKLDPIAFEDLEARIRRWMLVPDKGIIKLLCAYYIANRMPNKAVWMMLIAPSGGGKTELLSGMLHLNDIVELSMITPNTFLSGMPGPSDASLLPQVEGKILLFKDWTTILSMQKDARAEIMSQLREIWDGRMNKTFGNGKSRSWAGKVSILAASTQAVDMHQQMYTHLGERFLNYRIVMPNRKEVAMRALENSTNSEEMSFDIQKAYFQYFKGFDFSNLTFPALPYEIKGRLVDLADFATMARSGVIRDFGMRKEVIFVPAAEMPTRIVGQLAVIAGACTLINKGEFRESDMDIIYKIALDSIPQTNRMVILEMAKGDEQTTSEIAVALNYPTDPIRMYLENLALLGVCRRIKGADSQDGGNADRWTLKPEFTTIIRKYEKIEALTAEEMKIRQEDAKTPEEIELDKAWDAIPTKPPETF